MKYVFLKRFFDIIFSLVLLIFLTPVFICVCVILKFSDDGLVFFNQKRIGYKNSLFYIFKFTTMIKESEKLGMGNITVRGDSRVTKFGKFLRFSKINELPQLFNVLSGQMSFIGPRPLPRKSFLKYSENIQKKIYNQKPGISGISSLIFRDEELIVSKVNESGIDINTFYINCIYPYKGLLELWYQKNISFKTDFILILITCYSVIFPSKDSMIYKIFNDLPIKPSELLINKNEK